MKLNNLKNIKPKNIKLENADTNYADYLYSLPQTKSKKQVWAVVGTIAAAVVMVLAVSLWAIIGRGVRGTGEPYDENFLQSGDEGVKDGEQEITPDETANRSYELVLQKTDFAALSVKEYKITGDDAKALIDLVGGKTQEDTCICMPTHTIVYGEKTYYVALGDGLSSHFTVDGKKHTFDFDEYKVLTGIFERCINDGNLTSAKNFDTEYRLESDTIKMTVDVTYDILQGGKWTGEYTDTLKFNITGDDAQTIYRNIRLKTYVQAATQDGYDVALEIDGRVYHIKLSDTPHISSTNCAQCNLDKNDELVTIIKKYVDNPPKPKLTEATQICLAAIKERKVVDHANENPTAKTFELDGKTLELTFKEKVAASAAGGYIYRYTDSDGMVYEFYENKHFIGIYDFGTNNNNSATVTKDEAFKAADKYARLMLGDDYENYLITESEDFNSVYYHFSFKKTYGKDGFLTGESYSAWIYKNGQIYSCDIKNKFMFEDFDASLVNALTKEDVDAALIKAYEDSGTDMSKYTAKVDSYYLTNLEGKWYVGVMSVLDSGSNVTSRGNDHFFEISW